MAPEFSIVIPVYNEAEVLLLLYERLTEVMVRLGVPYEVIFVNDGSTDASLMLLRDLHAQDEHVKFVSLSRNFGHQAAITAGLDHSSGNAVMVMDADLQDPPEVIPELIAKWREGFEVVVAVRESRRGETAFKRGTAALFYRLLQKLTSTEVYLDAADFRLMSRKAVNALNTLRERNRFMRGLASWVGFRQTCVTFTRDVRHAGETKYPLRKMLRFALDGITSFSFFPLQLATYLGFGVSFISLVYVVYAIGLKLFTDELVPGWASVIVAILFVGGVQLITVGIIGEYVGRIYEEVKQRPLYFVDETAGIEQMRGKF
jgi:polyisoprenyl-phosphate glycosyltransferase